jgi:polysaccharide export outer membrane protein
LVSVPRSLLTGRPAGRLTRAVVCALALTNATGCLRGRGEAGLAASLNATSADVAGRAATVPVAIGDRVRVKVWREPQYSDEFTVDVNGSIALPRLGQVRVAGLTLGPLQDTVRVRFAEYLRDPVVTVTVLRRVGLQGEVRAPGLYFVEPTTTLRDVIAQGGGLTEAANPSQVDVVREGRQLSLVGRRGKAASVTDLRSGDAIVVGRRSWLSRNALAVVSTLGLVVSVGVQVFRR